MNDLFLNVVADAVFYHLHAAELFLVVETFVGNFLLDELECDSG